MGSEGADQRNLTLLRGLVNGAWTESVGLRASNNFRPATGSILALEADVTRAELTGAWGPRENPTQGTFRAALAQVLAVDQHMQALEVLSATPTAIAYSSETVIRAALEAAARAWWLLDPTLDARRRVARGMTERIYSMRQMRKMLRELTEGRADDERQRLQERIDDMFKAAQANDLTVIEDNTRGRRKIPTAVGERRPDSTPLIDDFFSSAGWPLGAFYYRLLSAKAHATLHGLTSSLREISSVELGGIELDLEDGTRIATIEPSPFDREILLSIALMAHGDLTTCLVKVAGWPDERWKRWRLHVAQQSSAILRAQEQRNDPPVA